MLHTADFDSHGKLSSLLSIGKNNYTMTRVPRTRPVVLVIMSLAIDILPGVPNVGFVPVNTGKLGNLRPVSETNLS